MTFALNYTLSLRQVKPDAVFWPGPLMENQFGERRNCFYSKHWLTSGFIISAASDHHDRIMDLFIWMADGEGEIITNWGNEGEHWHRVDGEIEALPEVLDTHRIARPTRSVPCAPQSVPGCNYDPAEVSNWCAQINFDPNMILPVLPPFNEDERERLKRLITDVDNILNPALDGFNVGTLPMGDFDAYGPRTRRPTSPPSSTWPAICCVAARVKTACAPVGTSLAGMRIFSTHCSPPE